MASGYDRALSGKQSFLVPQLRVTTANNSQSSGEYPKKAETSILV